MHSTLTILKDSSDSVVDVVFVHGLERDQSRLWTKDGISWPRDLLPTDIDKARIASFEYDAKVEHFWSPSQANIELDNHARDLCTSLSQLWKGTSSSSKLRPIIFVAHSLGGLVCAQALAFPNNRISRRISDATVGFMVFGTPLAGADPYAWLRAGESFFDFTGRDYPQDLAHRCGALSRLGKGFQDLLASRANGSTKIEVMCFYEEQETTFQLDNSFYKVVPQELACLERYPSAPIPANHADMCKFSQRDDAGYQEASSVLREWVETLERRADKEGTTVVHASFSGQFFGSPAVGHAPGGATITGGGTFHFGTANFGGMPQQQAGPASASANAPDRHQPPVNRPYHPAAPVPAQAPIPVGEASKARYSTWK